MVPEGAVGKLGKVCVVGSRLRRWGTACVSLRLGAEGVS